VTAPEPTLLSSPPSSCERELAAIWTELLGAAPVGTEEDFFAAGGDSIRATALVARACAGLEAERALSAFVQRPTIAALADWIDAARAPGAAPAVWVTEESAQPARCSYAQERFWFIDQASGSNVVSNVSWALRLDGSLDVDVLGRALAELALRHDTLRTRFELRGGAPVQLVSPVSELALEVVEATDEADAAGLAAAAAQVPFDLGRGPLLRVQLLALGPDSHVLHFVAHHIVCDDWSKGVILSELAALYTALRAGEEPSLAPPVQYPDYSRWQRARLSDDVLRDELEHWRARLAGAPAIDLPVDRRRPPASSMRGARLRTTVASEVEATLRALGREAGATFFMTMLAALQAFLYRYTRQEDLVVGTAIDNRGRVELERAVGLFTNVLALRGDVSDRPTFRELLSRARVSTLDAVAHQELPFDRLAAATPERDASRHPIFQVFYEFIVPAPLDLALPGVRSEPFEVPKRTSEFDLGLYLDEQRGGLDAVWEYSSDLFEPATIERMASHFMRLLEQIVADPDRPIDELPLLDDAQRRDALSGGKATAAAIPQASIQELFEGHAQRAPDALALIAGEERLSYGELNRHANSIAHLLAERGVAPGDAVGLCLERSADLVAAMLGILKAGGAYLPLHPDHPPARLLAQLETAGARMLIAGAPLEGFAGELISLERERDRLASLPETDPEQPAVGPDNTAYVLFTSGSTGVPKGVAVTQRNLVNYAVHMIGALGEDGTTSGLHFGSVSALSTDLGNTAIFPALAGGGCLHLIATDVATDGAAFASYLADRPLDVLKITPSHLGSLLDAAAGASILPSRWLILGGEALSWELAERVMAPGGPRVVNHYGPTEATIGCCTYELELERTRPPAATVPIGRPISGATAYVLDALMEPVPVGVAGELYIGGAGVARGYVNQPEQTAEVFVADPFSEDPGARLYRTGDLARRLPDASVEFLGRADQQVKIRGFRVEPAEVQAALMREPGVRQAAVLATGEGDGRRLVAYVVADDREFSSGSLQDALAKTLPAYMVPSQIAMLDSLPLTPNGKLDRASLPSLEAPAAPRAEPMTELEAELAAVWEELLEHEVGPEESFFEVGGHSLLAIRLVARIRSEFGVKLTLKALIEAPTVSQLAARIESARESAPAADASASQTPTAPKPAPTVPRAPREGPLRCSFAQEQFWLVDRLTPGSSAYNFSWPMRLAGRLDTDALGRAVAAIVSRHEALRTRFTATDGQPMQIVENTGAAGLELVDLAGEPDPQDAARRLIDEHTATAFDLSRGPLLRVVLMRLGEREHILLIVVHHIVFDGVSKVVLYRELGELYDAFAAGREPTLTELAIHYGDYAEWQRSQLDPERLERELVHWRAQLEGASTALELPTDRPRPAVSSLRGARHRAPLPGDLRQAVETLARGEGATFFMAVLAAFEVLLYRYTGQEDLLVGTPVDTRTERELAPVIGPFINTVVVRGQLSGSAGFRELLRGVQQRTVDALEHQELPFERLVAAIAPERDLSRHPLFQALLALNPAETGLRLEGVDVSDLEPAWSGARVDLFLILDDLPQGLEAIWEYSSDLFEPATIERMAGHFVRLLEEIVADPDRPIDDLALLGEPERMLLTDEWNRTEAEIPPLRLERLVAEQARLTPDRVAVRFEGRELSYGELDVRANKLANRLQALGAGPDELVGVCLNRSEELLVALLATMKTGAAYVPIDPGFPPARQELMLTDARVRVLLSEEGLLSSLPVSGATVLCIDRDGDEVALESSAPPAHGAGEEGLAYVIYTSGSTGKPKGVEIEHRALVNLLCSMRERPGLSADDVLVAVTTLSFDIAGLELYLPLIAGAQLVIASAQTAADPRALARLLESSGASVMQATPTTWRMLIDSGWTGRAGLKALCGGEALPPALADELVACVPELWNMYGPTETTIWSTCAHVRSPGEPPSIGRPIANTTLHVLDRRGRPAPIGVPGELLIGGAGLARGYRNLPELTAERFVTGELGDERLYRTGDLARYRPDGTLQFLGRLDHQIKLRGFRIELGEIEAVLGGHPAVAAAAATLHDGPQGEPSLIAYVVADGDPADPEELRRFLAESLPAYMVPAAIVALERLPLTPNAKIDRKALPAPELPSSSDDLYVEPRNATEVAVAAVFCEVLGVERAGANDDFFELGGQSLLAARLISRLDARLGIELPLRALFETPTVAGLAAGIEALLAAAPQTRETTAQEPSQTAAPSSPEPPPLLPTAGVRPASFAQERFWFIDQIGAGAAYNISWPLRLKGALDVVALERALNEIVRRHEILRTRFAVEDGRPIQVIEPSRLLSLAFVDLSGEPEREHEAQRLVDEGTQAPFSLADGPLIRTSLLRLGPEEHVLQVVVHHAAADGGSKVVFFTELGALYGAYRDNRPAALPEPPIQYADYAGWQRSALQGEALERELAHWSRELDGIPAGLELPSDRPRPEVASLRGGWLRTKLADDTLERLGALARAEGATLFMVVLAAFEVLLHRYSGQEEVVVGTPVDTRGRAELEQLIGPFVNTLALRGDLSGEPSFRELLGRVKRRTLDAIEHQELPFERLVEALAPERELGRHPLFQALIALNPPEPAIRLQGLEVEELDTEKTVSRVDLTLLLQQRERGLELVWEYSSDLFEPATVQQMADRFVGLLDSIVSEPEQPIDELSLLGEDEHELPPPSAEGEPAFPVFCLHERFEEQARRTPDAVAVRHEDESLSYRELGERANRLAHRLRALGVAPDALVALCLERSLDLVVAVLATLKAGGAYVPLDPEYPAERLEFVLRDCDAAVLVTQARLLERFGERPAPAVVCVDRDRELLERESPEDPPAAARPESLAYVIYTSGSTGQPKGVLVEHRNVARLFTATDAWFSPGPEDTWTLLHSYAFDFSVWEIWGALLHGGTVVVVPPWTARSPDALAQLLVDEGTTVLNVTPSLFMAAMDELLAAKDRLSLRLVIFGGEALHTRLLAPWFEQLPDRQPQLVNMYGITETTVHVTYRPLSAADAQRDGSPIGMPIPDLDLYVLDAKLKPVPDGVAGELFVGGAGVARGYLNRPELTEQRFIPSPFGAGRLYRTGDRARRTPAGELLFEGRLDDQVKIRGFRIELGEVHAALAGDAAVAECAVIADSEGPGDARLAAYVVPAVNGTDRESLPGALRGRLRDKLPEYMVPSSFTLLEALPLTTNGKLDRRALPDPTEDRATREPVAPRTELERELAEVWRELLDVEVVGIEDDFFEMGGHSLLAAQLAARMRTRLGTDVSVRDVFEEPTIAGQARRLEAARDSGSDAGEAAPAPAIAPRGEDDAWPLSYSQQQLWLIDQWDPGAPTYNVALAFRVRGTLDLDALHSALAGVLARHEALRTVVDVRDDQPVPVLLQRPRLELESVDMSGRPEAEALQALTDLARRPFDLARDPLLRCSAIALGGDDQIVLIETHHIAFDGLSERVLLDELAGLYTGQTLPELPLQFGDFALWQHDWMSTDALQQELAWWRGHLAGARTSIELPVDEPRPEGRRFAGASHDFTVPAELATAARSLCREESATPYMLVLSALATLLYRITGQDDILVGSPVANRLSQELETLIGFFSNTLVFRVRMSGNPTFRELLHRVREMALDVYAHQGVPLEKIVEAVGPEREPGVNPLFQVNLRVSTAARPALALPGLEIAPLKLDSGLSRFDLALDVDVLEGGISGYFRYNRDIFEPATIARLSNELTTLLAEALADPDRPLLSFDLQGEWSERRPVAGGLRGFRARTREEGGAA
jgi:amino acid adenylation domain-containing protein